MTMRKQSFLIAGCIAIGVICAVLHPAQPGSVMLSIAFCVLWCGHMLEAGHG